jgi:hypothetical protein
MSLSKRLFAIVCILGASVVFGARAAQAQMFDVSVYEDLQISDDAALVEYVSDVDNSDPGPGCGHGGYETWAALSGPTGSVRQQNPGNAASTSLSLLYGDESDYSVDGGVIFWCTCTGSVFFYNPTSSASAGLHHWYYQHNSGDGTVQNYYRCNVGQCLSVNVRCSVIAGGACPAFANLSVGILSWGGFRSCWVYGGFATNMCYEDPPGS